MINLKVPDIGYSTIGSDPPPITNNANNGSKLIELVSSSILNNLMVFAIDGVVNNPKSKTTKKIPATYLFAFMMSPFLKYYLIK